MNVYKSIKKCVRKGEIFKNLINFQHILHQWKISER